MPIAPAPTSSLEKNNRAVHVCISTINFPPQPNAAIEQFYSRHGMQNNPTTTSAKLYGRKTNIGKAKMLTHIPRLPAPTLGQGGAFGRTWAKMRLEGRRSSGMLALNRRSLEGARAASRWRLVHRRRHRPSRLHSIASLPSLSRTAASAEAASLRLRNLPLTPGPHLGHRL